MVDVDLYDDMDLRSGDYNSSGDSLYDFMNRDVLIGACMLIWIPTATTVCLMILSALIPLPDEFIKV